MLPMHAILALLLAAASAPSSELPTLASLALTPDNITALMAPPAPASAGGAVAVFFTADDCRPEHWVPPMADPCEATLSAFLAAAASCAVKSEPPPRFGVVDLSVWPEERARCGVTSFPAVRIFARGEMRFLEQLVPRGERASGEGLALYSEASVAAAVARVHSEALAAPPPHTLELSGAGRTSAFGAYDEAAKAHEQLALMYCSSSLPACHSQKRLWEMAAALLAQAPEQDELGEGRSAYPLLAGYVDCAGSKVCAEHGVQTADLPRVVFVRRGHRIRYFGPSLDSSAADSRCSHVVPFRSKRSCQSPRLRTPSHLTAC
eukprot:COSAG01_NODE_2756_length_7129_cov_15.029730_12_plen_320_part_00